MPKYPFLVQLGPESVKGMDRAYFSIPNKEIKLKKIIALRK